MLPVANSFQLGARWLFSWDQRLGGLGYAYVVSKSLRCIDFNTLLLPPADYLTALTPSSVENEVSLAVSRKSRM